jgi:Ca-activated chloride channel family protein
MGLNAPAQAQGADQKAGDAILIMDYSNSMRGQINGVSKVDIARNFIEENFGGWNLLTNLSLLSCGDRYKNDCVDIQLISPPGELDTSIASSSRHSQRDARSSHPPLSKRRITSSQTASRPTSSY